jgi:capsular polysaccharide biosynthesis protein
MITVNTPTDTRILQITVSHPDASMAKKLADTLIDVSTEKIVKIMELERINVIEYGNMPLGPSSPNVFKNVLIGGIFGVFLSMAALTFLFLFNDTIKTSDDVEKYLGLNVLGVIPLMGNATNKKLLSKNRKKKAKQLIRRK